MGFYTEEEDYREKESDNLLLNKTIKSLRISTEKDSIAFDFEDGTSLYLNAEADCCSSSWFEHVEGVESLVGNAVLRIEPRPMPESRWDEDNVCETKYYGWSFDTQCGIALIEMRNESNGFYGGNPVVSDKALRRYEDRGYSSKLADISWRDIKEDF